MSNNPHDQIIKKLCKEILLPRGVFQKGSSRTYIDDNGWFLTIIEFQPSSWSKGTYLNIGLNFLWAQKDSFSFDFPLNPRIKGFIPYKNDEQFERAIRPCVETALEQVMFYRALRDIPAAEKFFDKWVLKYKTNEHMQELRMVRSLNQPAVQQRIKQSREYWRSKASMKELTQNDIYDK